MRKSSPHPISKMQDLSRYINGELAEVSAKLGLKYNTGILHSCLNGVEGGNTPPYTNKPMLLPVLPGWELSRITGQSSAIRNTELSWTIDSSASLHGVDISSFLSMHLGLVKTRTKKGRLNVEKNLPLEEIGPVASGLIKDGSIPFFINNYNPLYDIWIFFLSAGAMEHSAEDVCIKGLEHACVSLSIHRPSC